MSVEVGLKIRNGIFKESAKIDSIIVLSAKDNKETKKCYGRDERIIKIKHEIDFVCGKTK